MTRGEFIEILEEKGYYSYKIEGDKLVVTRGDKNGDLWLGSLETLPHGVVFRNEDGINLSSLETLPPGVVFRNGGSIHLESLKTLPPGVEFKNGRSVYLPLLIGGYFHKWPGNIEGIDSKRLLNFMISKGVFI